MVDLLKFNLKKSENKNSFNSFAFLGNSPNLSMIPTYVIHIPYFNILMD